MRTFRTVHVLLAALSTIALTVQADEVFRGVNLGGWLVTEKWMTPGLYNATNTNDEWHLCAQLGKKGCLDLLQEHWSTFYTRDDFVQIKNAGLSVRIPLGYWAVDLLDYEPYVSGQYPYLIQAVQWAGQLGLRVFIDIHGAPGSQNGYAGSGFTDGVDFLSNSTNANRTLNVLTNLTTEFSKDTYGGVVTNIEPLNEPTISYSSLRDFYSQAATAMGNSSGINFTISDGFYEPHSWKNYDPYDSSATAPAQGLTVDTHQFWAFPPLDTMSKAEILQQICNFSQTQLGADGTPPTLVGEWSLSTGATENSTTDAAHDQAKRTWFRTLFEAQNAAYTPNTNSQASIGWFFWAWKTQYDIDAWSYRKGLSLQYIPSNISDASTYVYPLLDDGCIDSSFAYTAPATVTATSSASNPSATGKKSFASRTTSEWPFVLDYGLAIWLTIAVVSCIGMAL